MICTACGRATARRFCPALQHRICSVCCGTKRQIEIRCPADCQHLVAAQAHPAAVVRRQRDDDLRAFAPTVHDLTEPQEDLMSRLLMFLRDYRGDGFLTTTDDDVKAAAAALAATFETASKGLIYEERPGSLPAQRLAADLRAVAARLIEGAGSGGEKNMAIVLRAIERGARDARKTLPGGSTAYLNLLRRLITDAGTETATDGASPAVPGGSMLIRP